LPINIGLARVVESQRRPDLFALCAQILLRGQ